MLNGVGWSETLVVGLAVAVALVAALLVYRDAHRHGNYHALSATGAVALVGLVGYAVGGVVGLFVGTGYVLLLYLLSYPTTPSIDPRGPRGDAGENIASESADDTLSVIRVEVANYETLTELAERYDDVPEDAREAKLRSTLRAKALSEVDGPAGRESDHPGAADTRPGRGLSDPNAPAARASEYGIEEWSTDTAAVPSERVGEYGAAEWTEDDSSADERVGDYDTADWSSDATDRTPADRTEDQRVSNPDEPTTSAQERSTEPLPERTDELAADAQQWVAANVDRGLGVTVGEALDTSADDSKERGGDEGVGDWSSDEPPAETETDHGAAAWSSEEPPAETDTATTVADWSAESPETNDSDPAATADVQAAGGAAAEGATEPDTATANGGVWDTAGHTTEAPERGEMVFGNAIEREETDGARTDTGKPNGNQATAAAEASNADGSKTEQTGTQQETKETDDSEPSETNADSAESGDDDPFDGRGELYDGDDTYDEEEESRY